MSAQKSDWPLGVYTCGQKHSIACPDERVVFGCVHLWAESETLSVEHLLYSACPEERLVYGCVHLWTGTLYRVPRGVIGQWVCTPVDRNIPLCRVPRGAIDLWVCTPVDRNIILRA